jgi:2-dehydro-3-deoxyphosphogluconate aldolase/(4S)-4-hydroxy-2-oxoglutarate aldolase
MRAAVPEAIVGAGTVRSPRDVAACRAAGAHFGVSPGAPAVLLDALGDWPFLPGCATATEAMALADRGFRLLKFFPADAAGGPAFLKALAAPLPDIRFCPTGGVSPANAANYLALPNVDVVGGSWIAPVDAVRRRQWDKIENLAGEAASLGR